jgi:hypothetical protein
MLRQEGKNQSAEQLVMDESGAACGAPLTLDFDASEEDDYFFVKGSDESPSLKADADKDAEQLPEDFEAFARKPWHRRVASMIFAGAALTILGVGIAGTGNSGTAVRKKIPVPMLPSAAHLETSASVNTALPAPAEKLAGN